MRKHWSIAIICTGLETMGGMSTGQERSLRTRRGGLAGRDQEERGWQRGQEGASHGAEHKWRMGQGESI